MNPDHNPTFYISPMMRWTIASNHSLRFFALVVIVAVYVMTSPAAAQSGSNFERRQSKSALNRRYSSDVSSAAFIENRGQFDPAVKFQLKTSSGTAWFTNKGLTYDFCAAAKAESLPHQRTIDPRSPGLPRVEHFAFAADFIDANLQNVQPLEQLPGLYNFLAGSDSAKWKTGVHGYKGIVAHSIWPGIDLKLSLNGSAIEQEFVLQVGANPEVIRILYRGAEPLTIRTDGSLVVTTATGELTETKPFVYQRIAGRRLAIEARFKLINSASYTFDLGPYDTNYPLVVDPTLLFSTYLGGGGAHGDKGNGVAVDAAGNMYVVGTTTSADFPTTIGSPKNENSGGAVFVSKLNAAGTGLVYSTYISSPTPWWDPYLGEAISVDRAGSVYIAGWSVVQVNPYPSTPGAFQQCGSRTTAFLTKLNPSGDSLQYSSCIGPDNYPITLYLSQKLAIAADDNGHAYLVGTSVCGFPTTSNAFQQSCAGPPDTYGHAFLAVFDTEAAGKSSLIYASYLGGSQNDVGTGVALDGSNNVYVAGYTRSPDFPTTVGAYQPKVPAKTCKSYNTWVPCNTGFIARINPSLTANASLLYSTHLGSSADGDTEEFLYSIAADQAGAAYVTGFTSSSAFPTTSGAFQTTNKSGVSGTAFVAKLAPSGSTLLYSTYLGGSNGDVGYAIAVDNFTNSYITGWTGSSDFPIKDANQPTLGGGLDGFVTEVNPQGSTLVYSTFLGGKQNEQGFGIAVDSSGNATVTGVTYSLDFPIRLAYQPVLKGVSNAFVTQFGPGKPPIGPVILRVYPSQAGNAGSATISFVGSGFVSGAGLSLSCPSQASVPASNITISPDGTYMTATFSLIGVVPQQCDIALRNIDGSSTTVTQGFVVQQGGAPDIWVDFIGRNVLRAGLSQTYYILVGNRGNVDSPAGEVVWVSFPAFLTYKPLQDKSSGSPLQIGSNTILFFQISTPISPGGTLTIPLGLTAPDNPQYAHQAFQISAWAGSH